MHEGSLVFASPRRRRDAIAMLLGASATLLPGTVRAEAMSKRAFRDLVLLVMRAQAPGRTFELGADEEEVRSGSLVIYLGNLYATTRDMPPDRQRADIVKWVTAVLNDHPEQPSLEAETDGWGKAKPLLRPKVVSTDYVKQAPALVHQAFSPELVIAYAIDFGNRDQFVQAPKLAKWGMPLAAVHAAAIANLEAMSMDLDLTPARPKEGSGNFIAISKNDAYDAARILLPGLRTRLLGVLGPTIFGAIPNRDFFIVWSRGFSAQRGFIAQIHKDALSQPYPLTDTVFAISAHGVAPATAQELQR